LQQPTSIARFLAIHHSYNTFETVTLPMTSHDLERLLC